MINQAKYKAKLQQTIKLPSTPPPRSCFCCKYMLTKDALTSCSFFLSCPVHAPARLRRKSWHWPSKDLILVSLLPWDCFLINCQANYNRVLGKLAEGLNSLHACLTSLLSSCPSSLPSKLIFSEYM